MFEKRLKGEDKEGNKIEEQRAIKKGKLTVAQMESSKWEETKSWSK